MTNEWGFWADLVLYIHFAYVLAVLAPIALIPIGARLGWEWVRSRKLRAVHVGMMGFVLVETIAGAICPLTWLEYVLREKPLDGGEPPSFVRDWVSRLLFYEGPAWIFLAGYAAVFVLIVWLWLRVPPRAKSRKG